MMKEKFLKIFNKVNESSTDNTPRFFDLTPVDHADPDGSYTNALNFAFKNERIKNIALTGPYGSGKSSIIRTFEKNSNYKFLDISLASFRENATPDKEGIENTILIERSILQQMLYGADANSLPYSRFKRITTPVYPLAKSFLFVFWALSAFSIYYNKGFFLNFETFTWLWLGGIFLIAFILAMPVVLISDIYKLSLGLSFKKISLTNAEIETGDVSEKSILNRHLDEIIYFFQVTDYDAVVIEDLDRFGSPEIFVKLREINKLINDNKKTSGKIKFLYALKDDMFAHNDRAKFFDFIIPVVPIINSSNSLDKMQERIKEETFKDLMDLQFLREVSLYIDDLRIIHNIFNEFIIYYERLKSDSLDATKLLAMMIYKNTYPNDFEQLHHGKGALFEVCKIRLELLIQNKNRLRNEITVLRKTLEAANNEQLKSIQELINVYIGHLVIYANQPVFGIVINNQHISFSQLTTYEKFEPLLNEKNIHLATQQQSHPSYSFATNKSFSQLDAEINPNETFLERKKNIEVKLDPKRNELNLKICFLEQKIIEVPQKQLHLLLQENEVSVDSLIDKNTTSDVRLLVYLIRNGYLDENYHIYTSNFHEGRLTKNDRDFLLTIRNFIQPDPKQQIDTPGEVCKNMRLEDFGHKYVLNVDLMDYLIDSKEVNQDRIASALQYISQNFKVAEDFFVAYYDNGKNIDTFIRDLAVSWPEFSSSSIKSAQAAEHVSFLLRFVEPLHITENMNQGAVITKFISEQGHLVFASDIKSPEEFAVLKDLNVKFFKVKSVETNKSLLDYAHKKSIYTITPENVKLMIDVFSNKSDCVELLPETANYTTISSCGSDYLKKYVSENLSLYIENVFLSLPDNTLESGDVIRELINNTQIDDDHRKKIITKEQFIFDDFEGIPMDLWGYLLFEKKVIVSWRNISEYLKHDENEKDVIAELLGRQHIVDILIQTQIDSVVLGEERSKTVSEFIIINDKIPNGIYCELIKKIPYKYKNFPNDLSDAKLLGLVKENRISLNEDSFKFAEKSEVLLVNLIVCNVEEYFKNKEKYPLSDKSLALLLSMQISNEYKVMIIQDITPSYAQTNKALLRLIANVVKLPAINCNIFDEGVVSAAIINAANTQDSITILTKCILFRNEEWAMNVLSQLPTPFNEIASYGRRPNLPITKENRDLAKLLENKKFVSSITEKSDVIRINTFKSSDHSEVE